MFIGSNGVRCDAARWYQHTKVYGCGMCSSGKIYKIDGEKNVVLYPS